MSRSVTSMLAWCAAIVLVAQAALSAAIISDTFSGGTTGASIAGRTTDEGNRTWTVSGSCVGQYAAGGKVSGDGSGYAAQGVVSALDSSSGGPVNYWGWVYINADVYLDAGDEYVSLGFSSSDPNAVGDWNNTGLPTFRFKTDGSYDVYGCTGGSTNGLFTTNAWHNVAVAIHQHNNSNFMVFVDGQKVGEGWYGWKWGNGVQVRSAGFRLNPTGSDGDWALRSQIDNFVVDYALTRVPEPATMALLAMGVLGFVRRRVA